MNHEGSASPPAYAYEWRETTSDVSDNPEGERAPSEPESLIDEERADAAAESKPEAEKITINYVDKARDKMREEIAERYKFKDGNILGKFINKTKAIFAGEFSDLTISKRMAEASSDDQAKELKKAFRLFGRDGALRLGKVGAKTGVALGIGAGITALLGGTIGSPVFAGALLGAAGARGVCELVRHFKKDEREGRTKVIESRAKVFAEAGKLQDQVTALITEKEGANEQRQAEIEKELEGINKYFVDLLHYQSYQTVYAENEGEKQLNGLAEVNKLGHEKMRLEKKREKIADLVAAGGSLVGGLVGGVVQSNLMNADIDKVRGVWADLDNDKIQHFVERINPSDIKSADPAFYEQLQKSGGYVFNYAGAAEAGQQMFGSAVAEHGVDKAAQATTAFLNNGNEVHVLSGMNDSWFRELITQNNPELAERASAIAGSFWKEAVPIAGANLLMAAEYMLGLKPKDAKQKVEPGKPPIIVEPGKPPIIKELPANIDQRVGESTNDETDSDEKPEASEEDRVKNTQPDRKNLSHKEDMYNATRGQDRFAHERDVLQKLKYATRQEARQNGRRERDEGQYDVGSAKHLRDFVLSISDIYHSNPGLLKESGISFHEPLAANDTADRGYERVYTLITTNENGETEAVNVPIYPDGKIDMVNTRFSRINPEDNDEDNLHILNPNKATVEKYINGIIDRLEPHINKGSAASVPEEAINSTPESNAQVPNVEVDSQTVKTEDKKEKESTELAVGDTFSFSEEFRNDPSQLDMRKLIGEAFFSDVDESKRTKKLMDSEYVISDMDSGVAMIKKKNGGDSDEYTMVWLADLEKYATK